MVDGVPRAAGVNSGRLDMYYIAPDGKRMRSMSEVYQYLGLTAPAPKSSKPVISPQMLDAPRSSREAKIYATAAISGALSQPAIHAFNSCRTEGRARGLHCSWTQVALHECSVDHGRASPVVAAAVTNATERCGSTHEHHSVSPDPLNLSQPRTIPSSAEAATGPPCSTCAERTRPRRPPALSSRPLALDATTSTALHEALPRQLRPGWCAASVANPYPIQQTPVPLTAKRARLGTISGPGEARPYLDAEVRLAVEDPERWKEALFPVDARSRASADAYEVSLRQSCAAAWRAGHSADVRTLADRMSAQLKESQQGMQVRRPQLEKQRGFRMSCACVLCLLARMMQQVAAAAENVLLHSAEHPHQHDLTGAVCATKTAAPLLLLPLGWGGFCAQRQCYTCSTLDAQIRDPRWPPLRSVRMHIN